MIEHCWIANSRNAKITNTARRVSQNCLKSKADWADKADRADMADRADIADMADMADRADMGDRISRADNQ